MREGGGSGRRKKEIKTRESEERMFQGEREDGKISEIWTETVGVVAGVRLGFQKNGPVRRSSGSNPRYMG